MSISTIFTAAVGVSGFMYTASTTLLSGAPVSIALIAGTAAGAGAAIASEISSRIFCSLYNSKSGKGFGTSVLCNVLGHTSIVPLAAVTAANYALNLAGPN